MSGIVKFVQGNEACVEAALYAGMDFFAGYPITPSTEIAELMAVRLPQKGACLSRWRMRLPLSVQSLVRR